jgi:aminopeptidase N
MHSRKDTEGVYSQFVYQKGAALLLMLDGWLGETQVRDGLRQYLKAHQFGNATTADLESSIQGSAAILDGFLNQTGIPSLRVKCKDARLIVDQTNHAHDWNIPLCWRGAGTPEACTVLGSAHAEIPLKSCPAWIYPNSKATAYFRTEWSDDQLAALDLKQLSAAERLTLIYDLRAQKLTSPILKTLESDPEPEVAKAATDVIAGK